MLATLLQRLGRKITNTIAPEHMVGPIGRPPVNRKERRAAAKIARTQSRNRKKETK